VPSPSIQILSKILRMFVYHCCAVPDSLRQKKGGRRRHLLISQRWHLLPPFLSNESGPGLIQTCLTLQFEEVVVFCLIYLLGWRGVLWFRGPMSGSLSGMGGHAPQSGGCCCRGVHLLIYFSLGWRGVLWLPGPMPGPLSGMGGHASQSGGRCCRVVHLCEPSKTQLQVGLAIKRRNQGWWSGLASIRIQHFSSIRISGYRLKRCVGCIFVCVYLGIAVLNLLWIS
jgi:hypothetical protein